MVNWAEFVQWAFYGLISGVAIYAASILSKLKDSVESLNIQMAKVFEKAENHEKDIERLERRLERLEHPNS